MKNVFVFDIDGTIAEIGDRVELLRQKPIDWEAFYSSDFEHDKRIRDICNLAKILIKTHKVLFCTGRDERIRLQTLRWLQEKISVHIRNKDLIMRNSKDRRKDADVKPEMLFKQVKKENILVIFEDKSSVVKEWRRLGITCCQVSEGNF